MGFYGGTFDPVHLGHVHAAQTVRQALGLTHVHMVLSARPGHRGQPAAQDDHRWQMLQLACAEEDGLIADDRELRRDGPSYTYRTLSDLRREEPHWIPCWVVGQDSFATLPTWHRWRELLEYCNFVVVDRPGDQRAEPQALQEVCEQHTVDALDEHLRGQILRLDLPMQSVSATQIRRLIAAGESVEHLLAAPICHYISAHHLYVDAEKPT